MENKSYNLRALRGDTTYDDAMLQQDLKEDGINIPDDLLFKPEINNYVASEYKKYNTQRLVGEINPQTGVQFTPKEAEAEANKSYEFTMAKIKTLSNK